MQNCTSGCPLVSFFVSFFYLAFFVTVHLVFWLSFSPYTRTLTTRHRLAIVTPPGRASTSCSPKMRGCCGAVLGYRSSGPAPLLSSSPLLAVPLPVSAVLFCQPVVSFTVLAVLAATSKYRHLGSVGHTGIQLLYQLVFLDLLNSWSFGLSARQCLERRASSPPRVHGMVGSQ